MTSPFPPHYHANLRVEGAGAVLSAPPRPDLIGGAPVEFDGRDDWWSPEGLLMASVSLCIQTTFQSFARRQELQVLGWSSHAEGVLDKTPAGLAFTAIRVELELVVRPEDVERATKLVATAERHCLISNALKTPVTVTAQVTTVTPPR
jgi:organic hydroperoxide reductase OsmC/OhrA